MRYVVATPWLNRVIAVVDVSNTLLLRKCCREFVGRRRSAKLRYRQIGSNSFQVETNRGWPVMTAYAQEQKEACNEQEAAFEAC